MILKSPMNFESAHLTFAGVWKLERQITENSCMAGQATLTPCAPGRFSYREDLSWVTAHGEKIRAFREFLFQVSKDAIELYFADGSSTGNLFMKLLPSSDQRPLLAGHHICKLDTYRGTIEFLPSDQFKITYSVVGPKKDYAIETLYTRHR